MMNIRRFFCIYATPTLWKFEGSGEPLEKDFQCELADSRVQSATQRAESPRVEIRDIFNRVAEAAAVVGIKTERSGECDRSRRARDQTHAAAGRPTAGWKPRRRRGLRLPIH